MEFSEHIDMLSQYALYEDWHNLFSESARLCSDPEFGTSTHLQRCKVWYYYAVACNAKQIEPQHEGKPIIQLAKFELEKAAADPEPNNANRIALLASLIDIHSSETEEQAHCSLRQAIPADFVSLRLRHVSVRC